LANTVEVKAVAADIYQSARRRIMFCIPGSSHILVDCSTQYENDNDGAPSQKKPA
jgi:hypothetical protein